MRAGRRLTVADTTVHDGDGQLLARGTCMFAVDLSDTDLVGFTAWLTRPDASVRHMEFGIFNSLYLPHHLTDADPEHAEHNRLMDEVAWTKAADANGFKYTWATEHHFLTEYSHLSANEVVPRLRRRARPSASTSAPASSTSRRR